MKLFILSCLIASSFALVHPKCKTESAEIETQLCRVEPTKVCGTEEDGEIVFQHVVPGEPVCIDVVDTFCRPALKEEDSCKEVTRKACALTFLAAGYFLVQVETKQTINKLIHSEAILILLVSNVNITGIIITVFIPKCLFISGVCRINTA